VPSTGSKTDQLPPGGYISSNKFPSRCFNLIKGLPSCFIWYSCELPGVWTNYASIMLLWPVMAHSFVYLHEPCTYIHIGGNVRYILLWLFCCIVCTYNCNIFFVISVRRSRVLQYTEMVIKIKNMLVFSVIILSCKNNSYPKTYVTEFYV